MRILNGPEFEAAVAKEAWAAVVNGRVVIKSAAQCYTTDFECGGIVGADMSEILLNEFIAGEIDSGLLQVVAGDPSSRHQGAVINYMLNLMGQESRSIYDFNFQFQAEGLGLLAVMSWCLWHLMSDRVQVPAGETKVIDAVQQTTKFPPPRAPVAPPSDESILSSVTNGSVTVRWEDAPGATATTPYKEMPPPSDRDAATHADFTLVDGRLPPGYPNPLPLLHDGSMAPNADERTANYRLAIGSGEGRVKIDLHRTIRIAQINSYSWHTDIRGRRSTAFMAAVDQSQATTQGGSSASTQPPAAGRKSPTSIRVQPLDMWAGAMPSASLIHPARWEFINTCCFAFSRQQKWKEWAILSTARSTWLNRQTRNGSRAKAIARGGVRVGEDLARYIAPQSEFGLKDFLHIWLTARYNCVGGE